MVRRNSSPNEFESARHGASTAPREADELARIPGLGSRRVAAYAEIGIHGPRDLLLHLPLRHRELPRPLPIAELLALELAESRTCAVHGKVLRYRSGRRRGSPSQLEIMDETGTLVTLSFALRRVPRNLQRGALVYLLGRVSRVAGNVVFVFDHHEIEATIEALDSHLPQYALPAAIPQRIHRSVLKHLLATASGSAIEFAEWTTRAPGCSLRRAIEIVHAPRSAQDLEAARRRLAFEELVNLLSPLNERRRATAALQKRNRSVIDSEQRKEYLARLPFPPTAGQVAVFDQICDDLGRRAPMHRLLHGEVGAGKTAVAALAALAVVESGRQAAFLAPTTLLASQLAAVVQPLARSVAVECFTRATPPAERRAIAQRLRDGCPLLLIGTLRTAAALRLAPELALVVIDEQHRFGVAQRARLRVRPDVDLLVMSATPIPRSLALTLYGDLDLSLLAEVPPGRRTVTTRVMIDSRTGSASVAARARRNPSLDDDSSNHVSAGRALDAATIERALPEIVAECQAGGRVFVLCPQIEDSARSLASTKFLERRLRAVGIERIASAHGKRSAQENQRALEALRSGAARVLVATTVIEVGIDVREATCIVVFGAERFGLAQLHQLRGRVGRGAAAARCLLVPLSADPLTLTRLDRFAATTSGFEVAELDLETRGAGEVGGFAQHGALDLRFARLPRDLDLLIAAREALSESTGSRNPGASPRLPWPAISAVSGPG